MRLTNGRRRSSEHLDGLNGSDTGRDTAVGLNPVEPPLSRPSSIRAATIGVLRDVRRETDGANEDELGPLRLSDARCRRQHDRSSSGPVETDQNAFHGFLQASTAG